METKPYKNLWFLLLNGIVAIFFGLLFLFFTKEVVLTVVTFIGLIILLAGIVMFLVALYNLKKEKSVALMMIQAITSIAIGLIMMIFQEKTLQVFLILIGVWAIIVGIFQLVVLVNVGRNLPSKNIILFNGLLTIILGVIFIFRPFAFGDFLAKLLGIFSILFGIVMIYLAFSVRKAATEISKKTEN